MNGSEKKNGATSNTKVKQKTTGKLSSIPVRVDASTKAKLDILVAKCNTISFGRRVKPSDIIGYSLDLLSDDHLHEIKNKKISNVDRFEILLEKHRKKDKSMSREKMIGILLEKSGLQGE